MSELKHRPPKKHLWMSSFQIEESANTEAEKPRRITDRVTARHIAHIFAGVTRAGAASERPYEEKFNSAEEVNCAKPAHKCIMWRFCGLGVFCGLEVA